MKTMRVLIAALLLFPQLSWATPYNDYNEMEWLNCTGGVFKNAQAVTDVNTALTFTKDIKALYVKNVGSTNELYVDPRDGVAVAADDDGGVKIEAGKDFRLDSFQTRSIGLIASSGETTTAQVIACW